MAIIIFLLSVINFSSVKNIPKITYSDKIVHLFLYIVWTFIILYETKKLPSRKPSFPLLLIIPIVFGGCIEIIQQAFFPPRTAEWFDWFADIFGVIIGALIASNIRIKNGR